MPDAKPRKTAGDKLPANLPLLLRSHWNDVADALAIYGPKDRPDAVAAAEMTPLGADTGVVLEVPMPVGLNHADIATLTHQISNEYRNRLWATMGKLTAALEVRIVASDDPGRSIDGPDGAWVQVIVDLVAAQHGRDSVKVARAVTRTGTQRRAVDRANAARVTAAYARRDAERLRAAKRLNMCVDQVTKTKGRSDAAIAKKTALAGVQATAKRDAVRAAEELKAATDALALAEAAIAASAPSAVAAARVRHSELVVLEKSWRARTAELQNAVLKNAEDLDRATKHIHAAIRRTSEAEAEVTEATRAAAAIESAQITAFVDAHIDADEPLPTTTAPRRRLTPPKPSTPKASSKPSSKQETKGQTPEAPKPRWSHLLSDEEAADERLAGYLTRASAAHEARLRSRRCKEAPTTLLGRRWAYLNRNSAHHKQLTKQRAEHRKASEELYNQSVELCRKRAAVMRKLTRWVSSKPR